MKDSCVPKALDILQSRGITMSIFTGFLSTNFLTFCERTSKLQFMATAFLRYISFPDVEPS
jgi:hypothetical protein